MAEELVLSTGSKKEKYLELIPQIKAIIEGEKNLIANLANIAAALKQQFDFFWVGFYLVDQTELVLGPFQGPIACTRIKKGKGVCGSSWEKEEIIIVPDVDAFPGHIACSSLSKSEIVLPLYQSNALIGVLDVDSDQYNSFDETDALYLSEILSLLH
ncbi:MAG: GAF domain-containing protein [Chitinophagaceae bacterium]